MVEIIRIFILLGLPLFYFEKLNLLPWLNTRLLLGFHVVSTLLILVYLTIKQKLDWNKVLGQKDVFFFLVFLFSLVISSVFSVDIKLSLLRLIMPILGLFYFVSIRLLFDKKWVLRALLLYFVLTLLSALLTVFLFVFKDYMDVSSLFVFAEVDRLFLWQSIYVKGVIPIFGSMIITFPLVLVYWLRYKNVVLAIFLYFLIILALMLYSSRTEFLFFGIAIIVIAYLLKEFHVLLKRIFVIFVLATVFSYVLSLIGGSSSVVKRLIMSEKHDKQSIVGRAELLEDAWIAFKQGNVFWGNGWGIYDKFVESRYEGVLPLSDPHNIYMRILVESGLFGLGSWFLLLGYWLVWDIGFIKGKGGGFWYQSGLLLIVCSWLFMLTGIVSVFFQGRLLTFVTMRSLLSIIGDKFLNKDFDRF